MDRFFEDVFFDERPGKPGLLFSFVQTNSGKPPQPSPGIYVAKSIHSHYSQMGSGYFVITSIFYRMENNNIDLTWLWAGLSSILTGLGGWLFGRRKQRAEAAKGEAEAMQEELNNVEKAIAIWRSTCEDMKGILDKQRDEIAALKAQLDSTAREIENLRKQNRDLTEKIEQMSRSRGN